MIAKLKAPYVDRLNNPRSAGDDKKRQIAEAFESLNLFAQKHGGIITSPPGRFVTIEVPQGSGLPAKLADLGFNIVRRGDTMRVTGTDYRKAADQIYSGAPSPFAVYEIFETTLDRKK
jgi:hypothetical protein